MKNTILETKVNFGDSLTEILENKNITVQELADYLKVSLPSVYNWKKNDQKIKLSNLNAIANYFHCTIEFAIGRTTTELLVENITLPPFGQRIRYIMSEKKISTYIMRKKGYGSKYLDNWDHGADPFLNTLLDLSAIFECTIDHLVGRE